METPAFETDTCPLSYEIEDIEEESNGPEWYIKDDMDDEDIELIESSSEKTFGFETDHLALKGNSDYHNLIKTLALLETQRIKAIEDIDKLEKLKRKVRANPREYLKKFLSGDTSDIPARIKVAQVPEIDWSKYNFKPYSKDNATKTSFLSEQSQVVENVTNDDSGDDLNHMTVRGRVFDQSKPQTFNQLWTAEEQLRLEELLVEFPSERKENNRWRKIAEALGNRTTQQVCSRVQKYFKKLNKAGLPIPGHQLKTNNTTALKKKRRLKVRPERNSTFFPTQHLGAPQLLDGCDEEETKSEIHDLPPEMKMEIIKKVLECKKRDSQQSPYSHPGVKCAGCGDSPLSGTRWRCLVCHGVNLCSDCVIDQLNAKPCLHPPLHPLESLSNPSLSHWDPDYMPDSFHSTNYLDPNFVTKISITMDQREVCGSASFVGNDNCLPSNSSSDEGLSTPTRTEDINLDDSQCSVTSNCRLKRCASTPLLTYTSTPLGFKHSVNPDNSIQIPIVGYEVMEERARFTVYKIKIENKIIGDSWFIFRRYTDFVRLHSKLRLEFPKKVFTLPRKRWFGNNFSLPFIEDRIKGLQSFIDTAVNDKELLESQIIRDFFCLDEPPSYSEIGEESRAIFEALEDSIYQLRIQLRAKEAEIMNMRMSINGAQEKAVTIAHRLKEVSTCENCRRKVQDISDELQRVLCLQFPNSLS